MRRRVAQARSTIGSTCRESWRPISFAGKEGGTKEKGRSPAAFAGSRATVTALGSLILFPEGAGKLRRQPIGSPLDITRGAAKILQLGAPRLVVSRREAQGSGARAAVRSSEMRPGGAPALFEGLVRPPARGPVPSVVGRRSGRGTRHAAGPPAANGRPCAHPRSWLSYLFEPPPVPDEDDGIPHR